MAATGAAMTSITGHPSNSAARARPEVTPPPRLPLRGLSAVAKPQAVPRAIARFPHGFTLLELVLVMVILLVAAAIAVPSLSSFGKGRRTDNCAAQLVALTKWARTQAIATGMTYRLNIDPGKRTFWLTVQHDDVVESPGEEFGREFALPDEVTIDWNAPQQQDGQYIQFLPTGRTDPATIRLTDTSGGAVIQIGCLTATERYHVLTQDEIQQQIQQR